MRKLVVLLLLFLTTVLSVSAVTVAHKNQRLQHTSAQSVAPVVTIQPETKPLISELFTDVNKQRELNGLPDLALDERLNQSALDKCKDMIARDYWAHDTPQGIEPWTFIKQYDTSFNYAGENLEYGEYTSQAVVDAWMNSPGHRANILKSAYVYVGYAVCHPDKYQGVGSKYIVVQHFVDM